VDLGPDSSHKIQPRRIVAQSFGSNPVGQRRALQIFRHSRFIARRIAGVDFDEIDQVALRALAQVSRLLRQSRYADQNEENNTPHLRNILAGRAG